ncbi:MAG TPA: Smr/MutS family protein [Gemmatimonadales bacterium]|nr:Smr/MutS family protein [Gemmatimonadales bacterium]
MSVGGGVSPSVLQVLEFPAALERVAAHAVSPLGAARIQSRAPSTDPDTVRANLAQVAELSARILTDETIRAEPIPDIGPALELLAVPGSVLEGLALAEIGQALAATRVVAAELARLAPAAPRTAALRVQPPNRELEARLTQSVDGDGTVRDSASRELARARQAVRETRQRLIAKLEAVLGGLDARERSSDAAVTVRDGRYVIPVRTTARSEVGGIVHDESASGATLFVEPPAAIELGNELRAQELKVQREVLRVLRELTERLRPEQATIDAGWDMCIAFDDLCARARYAIEVNGFPPAIGPLAIRAGRHPLLVSGEALVVPFDLELLADEHTLLVSGPNTGGKTVFMKAVGLIALLAQSGVIPPIGPESSLPVFQSIFADIGDRQSIAESLSTFSAHVQALCEVLANAGASSLVLLDELGSGTDPAEGAALAAAVLRTLTRRRATTLATTHLGALKQLASDSVGVVNASLQFDAETLEPTYRLLKGVPGRSYGLAIAKRLGVAADVLAEAERALPETTRALDALLARVEARARELEVQAAALREKEIRVEAESEAAYLKAAELAEREAGVEARARALDRDARGQARGYLLEARRQVDAALAAARAAVDEAAAREARRLVEKAIADTSATALPEDRWMSLDELRLKRGGPVPSGPRAEPVAAQAASEVSLRGLRIDEAEGLFLKTLDDAVLAELPYLRVIHGKGTGAMRQLVHEHLRHDRRVKSFAFAPANQGGSGVTVVEFV